MFKEPQKIKITEVDSQIKISDKMSFRYEDIIVFAVFCGIAYSFVAVPLVGIIVGLISGAIYLLFRYLSWIYHFEFVITKRTKSLEKLFVLFNKVKKKELITNSFEFKNLALEQVNYGGRKNKILVYNDKKKENLLVLTSQVDIRKMENFLRNKTNLKI